DVTLNAHTLDSTAGIQATYSTDSGSPGLVVGDTVRVLAGHTGRGDTGSVYRYVGQDYNYTTDMGKGDLSAGGTVRGGGGHGGGGVGGGVYRYKGGLTNKVDLGAQDYSDTTHWTPVTTDLKAENYNDTSRWLKETTIEAVSVAASVAVGIGVQAGGVAL